MEIIQKALRLGKEEYYRKHLSIINPMLPTHLTEKEIEVLASFMSLDKEVIEGDRFNTLARKKVKSKVNLSAGGLSNYIGSLVKKGFLIKDASNHKILIREFLIPELKEQGYQFKLIMNE